MKIVSKACKSRLFGGDANFASLFFQPYPARLPASCLRAMAQPYNTFDTATGFDGKGSQEFLGLSGAPQKHRRLNLNAFAVVLNLLLPWVVFSAICWALSFSLHYKAPLVAGGREIRHASRLVGEVAFLFHRGHVSSCPDRNGMWRVEFQDAHFGRLRLEQHEHLPCCESCRSQGAAADGRRPRLLLGRKRPRLEESYELQGLGHPSLWARIRWRPMTTGLSA
eukprot:s916_g4.t1